MPQSSSVSIVWQDHATGEYEVRSISLAFNPGLWRESSHQGLWGLRMRENKTDGEEWECRKMPQVSNSRRTMCAQAWHWKTFRLAEAQTGMKDKAKLEADSLKWNYLGGIRKLYKSSFFSRNHYQTIRTGDGCEVGSCQIRPEPEYKEYIKDKVDRWEWKPSRGVLQYIQCKRWSLVLGQWQWR